jgi:ribosomal-protein-alanine N-acetyltransferase
MEILPANLLDLNGLRKLEAACFPRDAWPLLDLISVLSMPHIIRLKAVEAGQMVGFIAGDRQDNADWVSTVCVLPDFQRRGIGRALMEACEARQTLPRVRLCVREGNASAIHLYEKLGYQTVDTWHQYYNDKSTALVMEKLRGEAAPERDL